jgi:hypothetical protein
VSAARLAGRIVFCVLDHGYPQCLHPIMQEYACIEILQAYNRLHAQGSPTRRTPRQRKARGAFLRSEAWQSGLLHRAYPSADVWASNPLTASREFEPHRFLHLTSGTDAVSAAPVPDHQPRDRTPRKMTASRNIAPLRSVFQNAVLFQTPDRTRREQPSSQQADRSHRRAL